MLRGGLTEIWYRQAMTGSRKIAVLVRACHSRDGQRGSLWRSSRSPFRGRSCTRSTRFAMPGCTTAGRATAWTATSRSRRPTPTSPIWPSPLAWPTWCRTRPSGPGISSHGAAASDLVLRPGDRSIGHHDQPFANLSDQADNAIRSGSWRSAAHHASTSRNNSVRGRRCCAPPGYW